MLRVREATSDDQPAIAAVSRAAYAALRRVYQPNRQAMTQKACCNAEYTTLVGEYENRVVATVEYRIEAAGVHLRSLAVDPAFQRRGFGHTIIDAVGDIARRIGRDTITLYTIRETGNVPLFERLGFHVTDESIASWCDSDCFCELHEARMERRLA